MRDEICASVHISLCTAANRGQDDGSGLYDLVQSLLDAGLHVTVATTRCEPDSTIAPVLQAEWAGGGGLRSIACEGRPTPLDRTTEMSSAEFLSDARRLRDERHGTRPDWPAWFPVLDRERCTDCKQCLSFCLFDVYAIDEAGQVEVRHPACCKHECPACARICPQAAIIFPKFADEPYNGADVGDGWPERESAGAELASLLQGDAAAAIRRRGDAARQRFSGTPDPVLAIRERCNCLVQLQGLPETLQVSVNRPADQSPAADERAAGRPSPDQQLREDG